MKIVRVLIQRVTRASVEVEGETIGAIGRGYLLLTGITHQDTPTILKAMAKKIVNLRLFPDPEGESHFHRSLLEEKAAALVVSQFTLYANCRKGRRPSFSDAALPEPAERLLDTFVEALREFPIQVETGQFGAMMNVALVNEGPVSIWIDSEELLGAKDSEEG